MKIVIVGLGGVGGVIGGRMANKLSEHEVIFWCRGETLAAISANGLKLIDEGGEKIIRPSLATDRIEKVGQADVIVFATKNYQLDDAAVGITSAAGEKTVVIPLQNGVSASSALKKHMPKSDVTSGCVYISAYTEAPGVARQVGSVLRVIFGSRDKTREDNLKSYSAIEEAFKKCFDCTLTDNIDTEVWSKFLFLSPFAGATTLFKRGIDGVLCDAKSEATVTEMIRELGALAAAKGISLPSDAFELTLKKARAFAPGTKTSMLVDYEKGARTEIESLIGYVCRESRSLNVPSPTYDSVYNELSALCRT